MVRPPGPRHNTTVPLPDHPPRHRLRPHQGRNGRGCVITWAAGNGNESVDNDGYASNPDVIAVAACNTAARRAPTATSARRSVRFPSNDTIPRRRPHLHHRPQRRTRYNQGCRARRLQRQLHQRLRRHLERRPGPPAWRLVPPATPARHDEVKDILKRCCERIDTANGNYDAAGHSAFYGFGRLDAKKAVDLALPTQTQGVVVHSTVKDVTIPDLGTAQLTVEAPETTPLTAIKVTVDIEHTFSRFGGESDPARASGVRRSSSTTGRGRHHNIKRTTTDINAPGCSLSPARPRRAPGP